MEKKKELYVNEQVYDEVISRQEQNEDEGFGSRINEAYSYFNVAEIKKNLKIQRKIKKEGEQLVRDRQITLEKVSGGFLADADGYACRFSGTGRSVRLMIWQRGFFSREHYHRQDFFAECLMLL